MADEAQVIDEVDEEVAQEPESQDDPLSAETKAFDDFLKGAGAESDQPETEQQSDDDDTAVETDSGDETTAQEQETATEPEQVAEGPTYLMKQEAARFGVPQHMIDSAPSDAHLQWIIEGVKQYAGQQEPEPEQATEPEFKLELPEDEYGPDDPIRKAFTALTERMNARDKELQAAKKEAEEAKAMLQRREMDQAYKSLFTTFDEVLDSFDSPRLGKTGQLTAQQYAARKSVADKYQGLGADVDTPDEQKRYLAELALQAFDRTLVEQRKQKQQEVTRQQRNVLGGVPSRPKPKVAKADDIIERWDEGLKNGVLPEL